jgi:hypothetical protein
MATRSRIGILNEDGTVSSVYCHWDGYPSHHGKILSEHYTDPEKVKKLINLGSLSILDKDVYTTEPHTFEKPKEGVTVAYHRDRGEDYDPPRINGTLDEYFEDDNEEYGYLFVDGEWLVKPCYGDRPIQTIKEALAEDL